MSPKNNSNSVFDGTHSFDDIITELRKLVLNDKRCVSYTYVSQRFRVHVKHAIQVLDQFTTEEQNNGNQLSVNYLLFGNNNNDNEIKMERFKIVDQSELESEKTWFQNGFNQHIYSVSIKPSNESTEPLIELNFDDFECNITNKSDLLELQNLTYKKNPNIELRNHERRRRITPIVQQDQHSDQPKKSINTNANDNKPKPKANTKGKNSKKNKISNMFSKTKKEVKKEETDEECDQNDNDPFKSDSEEETKINENNIDESNDDKVVDNDSNDCLTGKNDKQSEEEVIVKSEQNGENKKKRHSSNQTASSEDEEEIIRSKKKSKSKRYKRIRISESASDEPQEESAMDKYVSTKKENSKPVVKIEETQETHVDEEGFTVTKTVKKEVIVENNCDLKTETNENKAKNCNEMKEKPKGKQNKNADKPIEKKAKTTKETKNKTQSSITSFFKPKQVSSA